MAAALFQSLCYNENITVQSAGIAAWPGSPASAHAITVAAIQDHAAQQVTQELLDQSDRIICLAANHARQAAHYVSQEKLRVLGGGVADPYGGSLDDYQTCAAQIKAALPSLLPDLTCSAEIIPTEQSHIEAIAQLEQEVFTPAASEAKLREKLALSSCHMLTALIKNEVAGFIIVDEIAGEAYIDDLAVSPKFRRQGIASKLLGQAEVNAILRGCEKIHLEARASNHAARSLYELRGYQTTGTRPNFYQTPTEDAILMTLPFH